MRLVILETSPAVSEWAAKYVMRRINDFKPGPDKYFVLGLPTGLIILIYHYVTKYSLFVQAALLMECTRS